jgi:hypothetical protein
MVPSREEFILDVRRAARLQQKPTVITDSELIAPDAVSKALQRVALWLTPSVVEKYDANDFSTFPDDRQEELRQAVDDFRAVAAAVPLGEPATKDQFSRGLEAFRRLILAIQKIVLPEWQQAVEDLIAKTEEWSADFGWRTRRVAKDLTETLLASYKLPQLQIYAEQHLYVLDPVARFVRGAIGAFDLSIQPSYDETSLYRDFDGTWWRGPKGGHREQWSQDLFRRSIEDLRLYDEQTKAAT